MAQGSIAVMSEPSEIGKLVDQAASGGIVAVIAGGALWVLKKTFGVPQSDINDGYKGLLGEVRLELAEACKQRDEFRVLLITERKERIDEREAWRQERTAFLGRINQLEAIAEGFERLLRRNGIDLPERKTPPAPPVVVETTLRQDGKEGESE